VVGPGLVACGEGMGVAPSPARRWTNTAFGCPPAAEVDHFWSVDGAGLVGLGVEKQLPKEWLAPCQARTIGQATKEAWGLAMPIRLCKSEWASRAINSTQRLKVPSSIVDKTTAESKWDRRRH